MGAGAYIPSETLKNVCKMGQGKQITIKKQLLIQAQILMLY